MKKRGICYIIAAMPERELYFAPGEKFIIAADAGLSQLCEIGISPDLCVGDFDSLGYVPDGVEVIYHRPEKDDTDTMLAVREALDRGYEKFVFYGAAGGRLDHTYANLQTLLFLTERGARGIVMAGGLAVTAISGGSIALGSKNRGVVSVFCHDGRASGVNISGLKYPLSGATLKSSFPLGVSNEFTGERAEIAVESGSLMIMWETDAKSAIDELYFA